MWGSHSEEPNDNDVYLPKQPGMLLINGASSAPVQQHPAWSAIAIWAKITRGREDKKKLEIQYEFQSNGFSDSSQMKSKQSYDKFSEV